MMTAESKIKEHFWNQELTRVVGQKTFSFITQMLEEMRKNNATIKTTLGGGVHSFFAFFSAYSVRNTSGSVIYGFPKTATSTSVDRAKRSECVS